MTIERTTSIEDLVRDFPASVSYLMQKGIKCLACGEPIWGTLETAAKEKGFDDESIDAFVRDLRYLCSDSEATPGAQPPVVDHSPIAYREGGEPFHRSLTE